MVDVFRTARPPLIIEQVEDALVEHLKASVSGQCKVEAFPDDPAKYDFANLPAALLIHYAGSQYQSAKGPANKSQARRMSFALVLLCRSLRGEGGAYGHLEDVRLAVQGATFAGAGPAEITRDALDDERDGVWRWTITIAMPIPAVARDMPKPSALMRPMISP